MLKDQEGQTWNLGLKKSRICSFYVMLVKLIPAVGPSIFSPPSFSQLLFSSGLVGGKRRIMVSSCLLDACFTTSTLTNTSSINDNKHSTLSSSHPIRIRYSQLSLHSKRKPLFSINVSSKNLVHQLPTCKQHSILQTSLVPLTASLAVLLFFTPAANAGLLSGSTGIESVPGPELPKIEFLNKFNEENQKRYAENDARFKDSPVLKELLEKSKLNKEKNKQAIQDKYCLRGAEWGVGDCSTDGMRPDERDEFIAMLKKKTGIE